MILLNMLKDIINELRITNEERIKWLNKIKNKSIRLKSGAFVIEEEF